MKTSRMALLPMVCSALLLLALWTLASWTLDNRALPTPWLAVHRLSLELWKGTLLSHTGISLFRVGASLMVGLGLAIPVGLALGQERGFDRYASPIIYLLYPIPKVVLLPLLLILLGIGELSKILLISCIVFFQVVVTVRDGARGIPQQLLHSFQTLTTSRWAIYRHVIFPACVPGILTSLRLSLATALAVLFLTETYATQEGLGYYIMDALARFDFLDVFAGVLAMSLLGLALFWALERLEEQACCWR